ncbi:MAG TPA: hemerythrin domain-containing protein [Acidimicrobiales bacterium]|nr:hemerythrin domain-containing protein [Acidimicrobiales bacterium]
MTTRTQARDIAQFIRDQHQEIKRLFTLVDGQQGDGRREALEDLVRLLAVHETAEEEVIYPVVRRETGGDEIADARIQEESEAKRMLADLEKVDVDSDEFAPRFVVLRDAVVRHATSEEATVLPLLERTQDQDMLDRMGQAIQVAQKLAPTRPHPHGPDSALGNLAVGPFAAIADRARDALRNLTR